MTMKLTLVAFLLIRSLSAQGLHDCPLPLCSSCVPVRTFEAPGIGIDLSFSSASSAVRYFNWSSTDVASIAASDEYATMMQRLSAAPRPSKSALKRYLRRLNKALGRPATPEVGIISSLLSQIKNETERVLSLTINKVVVAAPSLDALTLEDLNDAIEYSDLQSWTGEDVGYPTWSSEATSALGAYGEGLCKRYRYYNDCFEEELPWLRVYAVSFTRKELYTTIFLASHAFTSTQHVHSFDFKAGLDALEAFPTPSDYWKYIEEKIAALPKWASQPGNSPDWPPNGGKINRLLLIGDSAANADFHVALKNALSGLEETSSAYNELFSGGNFSLKGATVPDPKFAAARGAAIYARWRLETSWECDEPPECDEERRHEHERGNSTPDNRRHQELR